MQERRRVASPFLCVSAVLVTEKHKSVYMYTGRHAATSNHKAVRRETVGMDQIKQQRLNIMRMDIKHLSTPGPSLHFLFSPPKSSQSIVKVQEAINKCSSSYSLHSTQRIQSEYRRCAVNFNSFFCFFLLEELWIFIIILNFTSSNRKKKLWSAMKRSRKKDGLSDTCESNMMCQPHFNQTNNSIVLN